MIRTAATIILSLLTAAMIGRFTNSLILFVPMFAAVGAFIYCPFSIQRICCPQCRKSVGSAIAYSIDCLGFADRITYCPHCLLKLRTPVSEVLSVWEEEHTPALPEVGGLTFRRQFYARMRVGTIGAIVFVAMFMGFGSFLEKSFYSGILLAVLIGSSLFTGLYLLFATTCPECGRLLMRIMPFVSLFIARSEIRYCPFCTFDLGTTVAELKNKPLPPPLPNSTTIRSRDKW